MIILAVLLNFRAVTIIRAYNNYALTSAEFATKSQLQRNNPVLISTLPTADEIKADAIPIIKFIQIAESRVAFVNHRRDQL